MASNEEGSTSMAQHPPLRHQAHGGDDFVTLMGLGPLWERSVKPYSAAARGRKREQGASDAPVTTGSGGGEGSTGAAAEGSEAAGAASASSSKPLTLEKTYASYVADLPGKVRPPKRALGKYSSALNSSGGAPDGGGSSTLPVPPELTGQTTMSEIVFRPETTVHRIGPFDDESLRAAFTVEAGPLTGVDLSLLESDEVRAETPPRKKKKKKNRPANESGQQPAPAKAR
ncbi:hypothetical protein FA10DRAFT_269766 [Acaromyces ingoldii]|uniref:Mediator of RNA polymerase II transcription subunit 19 n=1 Tax=Acaromyces ingoldii TaxID=215250 RepID=A0A316YD77_9BASI|nr:hypothetical protein FA10DRAFT_269766 [Acaromyces ingoldii]PWN87162.1 hypothetical protein FA10DRAFT_269766 [Acaromyces ingoldii]